MLLRKDLEDRVKELEQALEQSRVNHLSLSGQLNESRELLKLCEHLEAQAKKEQDKKEKSEPKGKKKK